MSKRSGGRRGRRSKVGRGKQTHRQNNPAVPNPAVPGPNPAALGPKFPNNVIYAILTRLPVKSVIRFTVASESWRTMVSLPDFTMDHLICSPPALLLHGDKTEVPGHVAYEFRPSTRRQLTAAIDRIEFPAGPDGVAAELNFVITAQNGVVCLIHDPAEFPLARNFTLWNPATRSSLRIPVPETPDRNALFGASAGFGYNRVSNRYAVIRIVRYHGPEQPDEAYFFNFETGRWVRLGNVDFRPLKLRCDAVVLGVPYWKALNHDGELNLAWFDVESWTFGTEYIHGWVRPETRDLHLSEIRDCHLGAIVWERAGHDPILEVWTRAAGGGEWERTYRFDPVMYLPVLGRLVGFFGRDELVQEIILGPPGNRRPALCIINLGGDVVRVRCYCNPYGMRIGRCSVMRYRQSLYRLPTLAVP